MSQSIAIVGASSDPSSMSNKAIRAYRDKGWEVLPITESEDEIEGLDCHEMVMDVIPNIHVASLYVDPEQGLEALDDCSQKGVAMVYINPGHESDELVEKAKSLNIEPHVECCIRALGVDPDTL